MSTLRLKVHDPEDDTSPGSIFNKEDFNSEREFTSINGRKFDVFILLCSLSTLVQLVVAAV